MDCQSSRRVWRESGGTGPTAADLGVVRQHFQQCGSCRAWLEAEDEWREALREKLQPLEGPHAVKERLFSSLAQARTGTPSRSRRRAWNGAVALGAVVSLALAGVWWRREAARGGVFVAALAEDFILYSGHPAPAEFPSQDPAQVTAWLAGRVDFAVKVPVLPGATLLGGRLCTLQDRRVALSFYQTDAGRVSLFQMSAEGVPTNSLHPMRVDGKELRCGHRKGVSVLTWTERGVLFALVSDLPERDLTRLLTS